MTRTLSSLQFLCKFLNLYSQEILLTSSPVKKRPSVDMAGEVGIQEAKDAGEQTQGADRDKKNHGCGTPPI